MAGFDDVFGPRRSGFDDVFGAPAPKRNPDFGRKDFDPAVTGGETFEGIEAGEIQSRRPSQQRHADAVAARGRLRDAEVEVAAAGVETTAQREAREAAGEPAGDTWGEVGTKFVENLDDRAKRWIGGLGQASAAMPDDPIMTGLSALLGQGDERRRFDEMGIEEGKRIFNEGTAELERNAPDVGLNDPKRYAYELGNAFLDLGAAFAVSAVTRSPTAGASIMGAQVFGDQFGESKQKGRSDALAFADASFMGVTEIVSERIPLGVLMRPGGKFAGRVAKGAAAEGIQESVTEILQTGYDMGVLKEDMTWGEAARRVIDAGIIGAGAGGGIAAVTAPFMRDGAEPGPEQIETQALDPTLGADPERARNAAAGAPLITESDHASPLDTATIAEGKGAIARLLGESFTAGTRIVLTGDDGVPRVGTVEASEKDDNGERASIKLDNGDAYNEYLDDLRDAGFNLQRYEDMTAAPIEPPAPDSQIQSVEKSDNIRPADAAPARDVLKSKIGRVESGGNDRAKNPLSSASGRYQFIQSTWESLGGDWSNRFDANEQERLMNKLIDQNEGALNRAGIETTAGNLYLAHFLGSGGAIETLRNPDGSPSAAVQKANPFLEGWTNAQVAAWAARKMGGAASALPAGESTVSTQQDDADDPVTSMLDMELTTPQVDVQLEEPTYTEKVGDLDERLDRLEVEASDVRKRGEIDSDLGAALVSATGAIGPFGEATGPDGRKIAGVEGVNAAMRAGREDIADAIVERARRDYERRRNAKPQLAESSPRFADAAANLQKIADQSERDLAKIEQARGTTAAAQSTTDAGNAQPQKGGDTSTAIEVSEEIRQSPLYVKGREDAGRKAPMRFHVDEQERTAYEAGYNSGKVETAAAEVSAEPTEAQKLAGNYKHGHVSIHGLNISIENAKGSQRSGTDPDGKPWSVDMPNHYGYVKRTTGADGEQVDVYVGDAAEATTAYVIDQNDAATGKFDEHKVMLGYNSPEEARAAYVAGFSDGKGEQRLGGFTPMAMDEFKGWLATNPQDPVAGSTDPAPKQTALKAKLQGEARIKEVAAARYPQDAIARDNFIRGAKQGLERGEEMPWPTPDGPQTTQAAAGFNGWHFGMSMREQQDPTFALPAKKEKAAPADKEAHVSALREYVDKRRGSLDKKAIAKKLGITPKQAEAAIGALASRPDSGVTLSRGGRLRRKLQRKEPVSLYHFLLDSGGFRKPDGHGLTSRGRELHKQLVGVISSKSERSMSEAFDDAISAGYINVDRGEVDDDVFLQALEEAHSFYRPEDHGLKEQKQVEKYDKGFALTARGEIEHELTTDPFLPDLLPESDVEEILKLMAAGMEVSEAIYGHLQWKAANTLRGGENETSDPDYDIPFADERSQPELAGDGNEAGEAGEGSPRDEGDAERGRTSGADNAENGEPAEVSSTAPEHATVGVDERELAEIVVNFEEVAASQGVGAEQVTHVFDAPAKNEIVRLGDKVKVYHRDHGWMSPAEARKKIDEWEARAVEQGQDPKLRSANGKRIVLSLFDLSGAWSAPWEQAGYQVWRFDIQNDPEVGDINNFSADFFGDWFGDFDGLDVYAILAACPCTDFASSGARHFAAKDNDGRTVASVKLVQQTLATIEYFKPAVWAVENPVGRIEKLGGLPPWRLSFDPNHLGEPYTKKTLLWGRFNADLPVAPVEPTEGSKMWSQYGGKSLATKNARSVTPEGFSYGFFMANNAVDHPAMAIASKYDRLDRELIERAVKAGVTEEQISDAVDDFYFMELDDDGANEAIQSLIGAPDPEEQADAFGTRDGDQRRALEMKGEGRKKGAKEQKPVGSDGGLFDTRDTTGDLFSRIGEGGAIFYSALEKAVEANPTKRAPAAQWIATLGKAPGVKREELEWTGLLDWLEMQEGPIAREDVLNLVRQGGIQVNEVVLGRPEEDRLADYGADRDSEDAEFILADGETQFQNWSSDPSNNTYRELLITLPIAEGNNPKRAPSTHWDTEAVVAHARFMEKQDADGKRVLFIEEVQSDWHQKGRDEGYEGVYTQEQIDTRTDARGTAEREFMLKAEEAYHAAVADGRKDIPRVELNRTPGQLGSVLHWIADSDHPASEAGKAAFDAAKKAELTYHEADQAWRRAINPHGIPEAPFKSSWPALVMKRMIRYAVDNGFDRVAWTTGDEQAERYNLDKFIDRVKLSVSSGGIGKADMGPFTLGMFRAFDKNGREVHSQFVRDPAELHDVIGKELTEKLIAQGPVQGVDAGWGEARRELSGLDLRTGGEGMRAFYDRNLVNITNDLIKKYGAKVAKFPVYMDKNRQYGVKLTDHPGFDITPQMAQAAAGGFPLFNLAGPKPASIYDAPLLVATMQNELRALGIADRVSLEAAAGLWPTSTKIAGKFSRQFRKIMVALDVSPDPMHTFDHESIHALRELGLFVPEEWSSLLKWAKKDTALLASVQDRYGDKGLTAEEMDEELVADAYANWRQGKLPERPRGFVARALAKLQGFMDAIAKALGTAGLDPKRVLQDIEGGVIGSRTTRQAFDMRRRAMRASLAETPFGKWFGDSKVVDEDGVPLVVYHGTDAKFAAFDVEKQGGGALGAGFYFAEEKQEAESAGSTVISVYLRVERPLILSQLSDAERSEWNELFESDPIEARDRAIAMGHDGILDDFYTDRNWVAFEPTQIKATANRGTWDGSDPRILYSMIGDLGAADPTLTELTNHTRDLTGAAKTATTKDKIAEAVARWRTAAQDRMLPMLRTQIAIEKLLGRKLRNEENPYRAEELMSGKVGAQLETLDSKLVTPFFEAMRAEKVTPEEFESYLYARHAPERNARIAEINPEFGPGEGSGMTDIQAKAIMRRIDGEGRTEAFEAVAVHYDAIRDFSIMTRIESGLLSQEQADEWKRIYPNYAPLKGMGELGISRPHNSKGISVRGPESRRAFGRKSMAEDLIAHTVMAAEESIIRGEKNRVAQSLYALAKEAKDKEFWKLTPASMKRQVNKETGLVETVITNQLEPADEPYTVSLKIDGKDKRVTFNRKNPAAVRAAEAMRRLDEQQMNSLLALGSKLNRYLSTVNTSLNPEFVITNAFRDLQTATINLAGFDVHGLEKGVLRDYFKALKASTKGAFGKEDGEWGQWWREFTDEGGRVFYNQMQDVETLRKDIEKRFDPRRRANPTGMNTNAKQAALIAKEDMAALFGTIDKVNLGVENAVRLSAYKNARELGMSKPEAASLAKNLTVNFNRRGSYGVLMNSLYLFYNASVQGSFRIFMALKHRRVQKIVGGIVVAGAMMELLNALASGVDDDDELFYDKISDFEKSRNIIIMLPGSDQYVKLPMPWGYNAFYRMGAAAVQLGRGKNAGNVTGDVLTTFIDAFNPIGGSDSILSVLAPTIVDPVVDLARNRDFADRPIMPDEKAFGAQPPDSTRYWGSVNPMWKAVTDALAGATGGDGIVEGAIEVSPETLEHLFGVVTGAAGAFVDRSFGALLKVADGDPETVLTTNDLPLARKLVGGESDWYDKSAFYARLEHVEGVVADGKDYIEREDTAGLQRLVMEKGDVLAVEAGAKEARKLMQAARKDRATLEIALSTKKIEDAGYKRGAAHLQQQEAAIIAAFNRYYNQTVKQPVGPE